VANGPNIFQMLLVNELIIYNCSDYCAICCMGFERAVLIKND